MLVSGKTPLLRAKKLEEIFQVGDIYLKLEGVNPTGHKVDRIAEVLVKDAHKQDEKEIYAAGSPAFMTSLNYFAEKYQIQVKSIELETNVNIEALENQYPEKFLAIEGHNNKLMSQMILQDLDQEIVDRIGYDIDSMFYEFSYGYTVTSSYNVFLKGWMKGAVDSFPKTFLASYGPMKQLSSKDLAGEVDKAIYESKGEKISLTETDIQKAYDMLTKEEIYLPDVNDATAFAAFMVKHQEGELTQGKHVIILNQGQSMLDIQVEKDSKGREKIFNYTKEWLQEYGDPAIEMNEAIDNAYEKGYILVANRNGKDQGICILVDTGFNNFLPTYHLAYVGTDPESSGRGIGTELVKRAIEVSDGHISLHVDPTNDRAKKLYEKLEFRHFYDRMMYEPMTES